MSESEFNLSFRIERLRGGGFVARSSTPPIELTAPTREELGAKIRDKLSELTGMRLDLDLKPGESEFFQVKRRDITDPAVPAPTISPALKSGLSTGFPPPSPAMFAGLAGFLRLFITLVFLTAIVSWLGGIHAGSTRLAKLVPFDIIVAALLWMWFNARRGSR